MRLAILYLSILSSFNILAAESKPTLEHNLNYTIQTGQLEKGHFQYFYSLLRQKKGTRDFENLTSEQSETSVDEILKVFFPLDTKKIWVPEDNHYLAVSKFTYILPVSVQTIDEATFSDTKYLQSTLPKYKVTKLKNDFHVAGSFITPDFNVSVKFLTSEDSLIPSLPMIDREKMRTGKMKVAFMHQYNFGKVMIFKTAKMASALILYEDHGPNQTLVTQFILSNVINVPTKDLIRRGMIENLKDVVEGSRSFILLRKTKS